MSVVYNIKRTSVDANMHIDRIRMEYKRPTTIWWRDENGQTYYISLYLEDADSETVRHIWNAVQGRYWDADGYYTSIDGDSACDFTPSEQGYDDEYIRHALFWKGEYEGQVFVSNSVMYQPVVQLYRIGDNFIIYRELTPTVETHWWSMDGIPF